jgi:hypothetical protein
MESEDILYIPNRSRKLAPAVLVLLSALLPAASRASLIWDPVGTALSPGNFIDTNASDGLQQVALGAQYAFPFEGTTFQSVYVTTSGFLWLGGFNGSQCCILGNGQPTTETAFEQGWGRIAPAWADLRPDLGGSVDVNQISDANGTRTDITYLNVPTTNPANANATVSFQVQLFTTGEIVFSYLQFSGASLGSNTATVIGLTPLGGTPQNVDFTNLQSTGPVSSVFDYLQTGSGFNLSGDSFIFTPVGNTDTFLLSASSTPEPSTLIPTAGVVFLFALIFTRRKRISKY